jgi:hypothetical protein
VATLQLVGDGRDLALRELANGVADLLVLGVEGEVHARSRLRRLGSIESSSQSSWILQ